VHPGVAGAEGGEQARHDVGADGLGGGQRDAAAVRRAQVIQRSEGLPRHRQHA
jgi:hypothetical protein